MGGEPSHNVIGVTMLVTDSRAGIKVHQPTHPQLSTIGLHAASALDDGHNATLVRPWVCGHRCLDRDIIDQHCGFIVLGCTSWSTDIDLNHV
jgi:hypothetical protein